MSLASASATMVYAVGNAQDASMDVITHSIPLAASVGEAPTSIDAGSAGLAAGIDVSPFSGPDYVELAPGTSRWTAMTALLAALVTLGAGAYGWSSRHRAVEASS